MRDKPRTGLVAIHQRQAVDRGWDRFPARFRVEVDDAAPKQLRELAGGVVGDGKRSVAHGGQILCVTLCWPVRWNTSITSLPDCGYTTSRTKQHQRRRKTLKTRGEGQIWFMEWSAKPDYRCL